MTEQPYLSVMEVMRDQRVQPTAFHFSLVMSGYLRQQEPHKALKIHNRMRRLGLRDTLSSRQLYLRAKAYVEKNTAQAHDVSSGQQAPLTDVVDEFRRVLKDSGGFLLIDNTNDISLRIVELVANSIMSLGR